MFKKLGCFVVAVALWFVGTWVVRQLTEDRVW